MSTNKGIISLAEMFAEHIDNGGMDDDDDFTGTSYDGPPIIRASFVGLEQYERLTDSPNLMSIEIKFEYQRIRLSTERLNIKNLLVAIKEKLMAKSQYWEMFQDRFVVVDDIKDPNLEAKTRSFPFLAIGLGAMASVPQTSQQRNEIINVSLAVFQQRYVKSIEESILGA